MSIFKKWFGSSSSSDDQNQEDYNPYLPENNIPADELFMSNFLKNGGKFIYCENMDEVRNQFENILEENDWFENEVLCLEPNLFSLLDENKLPYKDVKNPSFLFAGCENLIADEGSVLFSSKQIKQNKPNELPLNIVVFATMSQIVANKSEGLRKIKNKYKTDYPTNITTFKYFEKAKNESFMQYGSVHKNLYLLLLEDL
jgi:hypothetical protein